MTRIVHYNHTGVVAGAERVLLNALALTPKNHFRSTVLSPFGPLQMEAGSLGVETLECYPLEARFTSNPMRLLRYTRSFVVSIRNLRTQFRKLQPEVVHANSVRAGLVATMATAGMKVPVVWHVHDTLPKHPLSVLIRTIAALSRRTSLIAVSHATARTFSGLLWKKQLAKKTAVLHNVTARKLSISKQEQRTCLRHELGAEGKFLVGCIGQICTRKNQVALVELFASVVAAVPNALLVIAGGTLFSQWEAYESEVKLKIHDLGLTQNVLLLGSREDVPLLLETLDLLVLPSRNEPFAMILLEAMAAGLPTVAFAVDGVPELLADRRTAWLVPPGDTVQMARTIVWASRHPEQRQRFGAAAKAVALNLGTPKSYAVQLFELLSSRSRAEGDVGFEFVPQLRAEHLEDAA